MPGDQTNELRDEAFRKIGRNLVNFQRLERALKLVIVGSDLRGYASQLARAHRKRTQDTDRKPLGWLVEEFFKTMYSSDVPAEDRATELNEVWMSVTVKYDSDKDTIRARKRELSALVKERNLLIHRSLARFDPDSRESCQQLISLLDEQNRRLDPPYRSLVSIIGNMQVAQQVMLKHLEAQLREPSVDGGDAA